MSENPKVYLLACGLLLALSLAGLGAWHVWGKDRLPVDRVTKADWVKGNPNSKILVIEYGDFECPTCKRYEAIVQRVLKEMDQEILFVYRHFPVKEKHLNAFDASVAAEAAGKQGKFWEMRLKLFENQDEWSERVNAKPFFVKYAQDLGLDMKKFLKAANSWSVRLRVRRDYQSGLARKLYTTPSFFVNGSFVKTPPTFEHFRRMVDGLAAGNVLPYAPTAVSRPTEPSGAGR